jgi:hypothetical protein
MPKNYVTTGTARYKPVRFGTMISVGYLKSFHLKSNLPLLLKFSPANHSKSALALLACGFSITVGFSWQVYCTGWSMLNPIEVKILFVCICHPER